MEIRFIAELTLLLGLATAVAGCTTSSSDQAGSGSLAKGKKIVTVFAASSTTNALDEVKAAFTAATGIQVQTNYAGSSTLALQIANGAEADVFLSANVDWADRVQSQATVEKRRNLLGNRLVVVVLADSDLELERAEDLLSEKIRYLALGDPDAVPAGKYARQALVKLGLWEKLKSKVASAEDVRHALTYVETGAAEAGIVYATDAAASNDVKVAVEIPPDLTEPVVYPVVLLKWSAENTSARAFYDYLDSPEAAGIFLKFGFAVLPEVEKAVE